MKSIFVFFLFTLSLISAKTVSLTLDQPFINPQAASIQFSSNEAIIPVEEVGNATHKTVISCKPAIKGYFEYTSSRTLTLFPSETLEAGQPYRCQLSDTFFKDIDSTVTTFVTSPLSMKAERFGQMIRMQFNANVDKQMLQKHLHIYRIHRLARTALVYTLTQDTQKTDFAIEIKEPVDKESLLIEIDKNIHPYLQTNLSQTLETNPQKVHPLDPKRKSMELTVPPRFIAFDDGTIGMRLYLPHYFYDSTSMKPFLSIPQLSTAFTVSSSNYLYSDERSKYSIPQDHNYYVDIKGDFQSGKTYTLNIAQGLKDNYSFQLRHDKSFQVSMGDHKSYIAFDADKPYLSSLGEVGISAINCNKVQVVIEHLLDQNYRFFSNFYEGNPDFVSKMSREVGRKVFSLGGEKNQMKAFRLSLKQFSKQFASGVYRITLHYENGNSVSKSVFYSDIGIATHLSNDQMLIFTTKLSNSTPLSKASIKIYSDKNELISETKSDDHGVALVSIKDLAFKYPKTIIVNAKGEQSFLYLDQALNKVTLPVKEAIESKYKGFIYLQSQLIRPGGDAPMLITVKDKNFQSASQLPFRLTITDPAHNKLYDEVLKSDKHGAINYTFPVLDSYKTGTYHIALLFNKSLIGNATFSVETFMPQRIKNSITIKEKIIKKGVPLEAELSSRFLFGAPASDLKAAATITARSQVYFHKDYTGYTFNNELALLQNSTTYLKQTKQFKLNKEGKASVIFNTDVTQNPPSILQAQIELTVFDGGRAVSAYEDATIYPYNRLVGVKLHSNAIESGKKLQFSTIVIDPITQKSETRKLDMLIKKRSWNYYYDAQGYYRWEKQYEDIERKVIKSGETVEQMMSNSGDYTLVLTDPLSGHTTTQNFHVSGWDYNSIDPTADMGKIQVNLAKKTYKKGDRLKIDLKSPLLKGHMLLTLESDKILWHKVIEVNKGTASLSVHLDFEFPEGLYLRTLMIRPTDSDSKMLPFSARSLSYIKPDRSQYKQEVSIESAATDRSNTTHAITVHARPNSSVLISLVDEGILQIKGQKPPQPFAFFDRIMGEKFALYDLYDKVMHYMTKGTLLDFGSDARASMKRKQKHLGPKTDAKRVKPFVYWSGILKADKNGMATVTIKIPDFNGEAKIVALAFDETSIGTAHTTLTVKDKIIIQPTFSRFVHVGDSLSVPITLFNTTDKEQTLTLETQHSDNLDFTLAANSVTIKAKSSISLEGSLHAKQTGKGTLTLLARLDKEQFTANVELPLYSPYTLQTKVYRAEVSEAQTVTVDAEYFKEGNPKLFLTLSDSFLSQLQGSVNALVGYPYGCAEQTSSKLLALLHSERFIVGKSPTHTKELLADRERFINEGIYKLYTMQKNSGEFGYWDAASYVNPYASIYASDIILELKQKGFNVSDDMIRKIYKALRNQAQGSGHYRYGNLSDFQRIYAAFILSREHQLDRATVNTLFDQGLYQVNFLGHYMMAAILKEAGLTQELKSVLGKIEKMDFNQLDTTIELSNSFYSKGRDLSFALYIHSTFFKNNAYAKHLFEAVANELPQSYATQSQAFMLRAVTAYYKEIDTKAFNAKLSYNKEEKLYAKPTSIDTTLTDNTLTITPVSGLVHYAIEVSNYLAKPLSHLPLDQQPGILRITRDYVNESNEIVDPDQLKVGELFYSKISLESIKAVQNIVVSDRIPSCFEIVNERLQNHIRSEKVKNVNAHIDYQDIRDNQRLTFLDLQKPQRLYNRSTHSYDYRTNKVTFFQPLRVLAKGSCKMPSVIAEAMYDGRITAYDKAYDMITITDTPTQGSTQQTKSNDGLKEAW